MLEVEVKYRLHEPATMQAQLLAREARLVADQVEEDHYLNAPDRDFARTDEALRLRRIGEEAILTYKGPKKDRTSKTRAEVEVPCPPGEQSAEGFLKLFRHLGYRLTAVVRKRRKIFEWPRDGYVLHACLDDVEGVGQYVELEIVAPEAELEAARACVFRVAAELGLRETERRSYLELLLGESAAEVS
jgi:adenylate cyclase class 2